MDPRRKLCQSASASWLTWAVNVGTVVPTWAERWSGAEPATSNPLQYSGPNVGSPPAPMPTWSRTTLPTST